MPISVRSFTNFFTFIKSKFNSNLPAIDPSVQGGLGAAVSGSAALVGYSLQDEIQDAVNQAFIPTQDEGFLAISASIDNIPQLAATGAIGYAAVGGVLTTNIPQSTNLTYLGLIFSTQADATVSSYSGSIGTLTYNANGTVQATTNSAHTLSTGLSVTISGASQTALNGTYTITAIDLYNFSYTITSGLGLVLDSGSYSSIYALLSLLCTTQGSNTNVGAGSALSINIPSVNSTAYVGINGLYNGTDLETVQNWRARELQGHNLTPGISTTPSEISSLKKVTGVTRIWVIPSQTSAIQIASRGMAGYYPLVGETLIYVVDDYLNPITPTPAILANCITQLQSDGVIPNWIPLTSFWVISPTLITPYISLHLTANNTTSMQTAIQNQLVIYFQENAQVGYPPSGTNNLNYKQLLSFIQNIQDPNTGIFVGNNFTFNGWSWIDSAFVNNADLVVASGNLPVGDPTAITDGYLIFS